MDTGAFKYTFTVFTPTYNRVDLLPKAYDSLRNQTFCDFEWVIVDDGSTDGTEAIVHEWSNEAPFPIHYTWQPNRGKAVAINRGAYCRGSGETATFTPGFDNAAQPAYSLLYRKGSWRIHRELMGE